MIDGIPNRPLYFSQEDIIGIQSSNHMWPWNFQGPFQEPKLEVLTTNMGYMGLS